MSFKTRSTRRLVKNTKRKFIFTILLIIFLLYATIKWILPNIVGGVGSVTSTFKSPVLQEKPVAENATLAPPVLNIPYEATNSAQIIVRGYSSGDAKVKVYNDDSLVDTLDADTDGTFTTKEIRLNLGTNNIYGQTVDMKNNESLASKTIKIVYDNEKPDLKIIDPAPDTKTTQGDQGRLYIRGVTENDSKIYINNTQQIVDSKGEFDAFISLIPGENKVVIKAVDKAANFTEITRVLNYDVPASSPTPSPSP